jgi:DNA repair exonuclease SbcCD nuclease subunit
MSKIAIIGDIHLSPKCDIPSIKNKVVDAQKRYLDALPDKLDAHGVKTVIFAGDIFSVRNFVTVEALNYAMNLFGNTLGKYNIHIIAGNHDCLYDNTNAVSSIRYLGLLPNVTVYIDSMVNTVEIDGIQFQLVPWITMPTVNPENMAAFSKWLSSMSKKPKALRDKTVIVGHFDMMGMLMEAGQFSDTGLEPAKFLTAARYTFSGHYHCRSTTKKGDNEVVYLGTPYQLTFAHVDTDCGIYMFDTEAMGYEFIENTESPRFMDCDDEHLDGLGDLSNYFVRYMALTGRNADESIELKRKLESHNPLYVKTVPYGGTVGTLENARKIDDEEAKKIMESDTIGLATMYMEKYNEDVPVFADGTDSREMIKSLLRKYMARLH